MPELKRGFTKGRMNRDLDNRLVSQGEYRDALNVEVLTSEDSDVGTVQTCLGNSKILSQSNGKLDLFPNIAPSQDSVCVGSIVDEKNNNAYWFIAGGEPPWETDPLSGEIYNLIWEDLIVEYNSDSEDVRCVMADIYKTRARFDTTNPPDDPTANSTVIDPRTGNPYPAMLAFGNFTRIYVENTAGIRPGMEISISGPGNLGALTPPGTFVITTVSRNVVIISRPFATIPSYVLGTYSIYGLSLIHISEPTRPY